LGPTQAPVQ